MQTSSGFEVLIDGGPKNSDDPVLTLLYDNNITDLEVLVITHNDADHLGGLIHVLESSIAIDQIYYNGHACKPDKVQCQTVYQLIADRGISLTEVSTGDSFQWDTMNVDVLNPQDPPDGDENEDSVVLDISFGEASFLFTGDIGFSTENTMIGQGVLHEFDLLKVPHHGSAYSTSAAFLNVVLPTDAVISVGANNPHGHPSPDTIARLEAVGATIYRTDLEGDISFTYYAEGDGDEWLSFFPMFAYVDASDPMPGENVHCETTGNIEVCASVSEADPERYSDVTVYGRITRNDNPLSGKTMNTAWHYKSTTSYCSGTTSSDGIAQCTRGIGGASLGYTVTINVTIDGYSVSTSFTPTD